MKRNRSKRSGGRTEETTERVTQSFELTRRAFLTSATAAFGLVASGGLHRSVFAQKPGSGSITRYPLNIPPAAVPTSYGLTAGPGTVNVGGRSSNVLAYNGFFPGPTFRANRGDSVNVLLTNGLSQETTVHWHGMVVPTIADGHPQDAVMPGGSYQYQYQVNQRAALNWYHPHPHMLTGEQVCLGLAGAFIVNDAEELALNLPSGNY